MYSFRLKDSLFQQNIDIDFLIRLSSNVWENTVVSRYEQQKVVSFLSQILLGLVPQFFSAVRKESYLELFVIANTLIRLHIL